MKCFIERLKLCPVVLSLLLPPALCLVLVGSLELSSFCCVGQSLPCTRHRDPWDPLVLLSSPFCRRVFPLLCAHTPWDGPHESWEEQVAAALGSIGRMLRLVLCFLSETEAKKACDWLRAAGFPQYAQLYEGESC